MKEFDEVYDLTALDQQLQKADIVIGCLPGTPETKASELRTAVFHEKRCNSG